MMTTLKFKDMGASADAMVKREGLSPDSAKTMMGRVKDVTDAFDKHEPTSDAEGMFSELWKKGWKHLE